VDVLENSPKLTLAVTNHILTPIEISLHNFKKLYPIGKGGFGRVWKIQSRSSIPKHIYALKEMSKITIYTKRSIPLVQNERKFLQKLNFPLLANMQYAFETPEHLYIVMDYFSGGDLRYHLSDGVHYTEHETKFILANIILCLQYIHSQRIFHRDVKPENLVFDSNGYLHLTDFGIAHELEIDEGVIDSSGTPGYMAPEALMKKPQNFLVDFFALGVLAFELMMGKRPYVGRTKKEIKDKMITKEIHLKQKDLPKGWKDVNVIDFINRLLKRKPKERLGRSGIKEVMEHPWLSGIDWDGMKQMKVKSPIFIASGDNFDESYANKQDDELYDSESKEYYLNIINENKYFKYFYYNIDEQQQQHKSNKNNSDTALKKFTNKLRKSHSMKSLTQFSSTKLNNNNHNKDELSVGVDVGASNVIEVKRCCNQNNENEIKHNSRITSENEISIVDSKRDTSKYEL
jgi:serine/threonine protein kinase